jgi:hypothetical protein
VSDDKHSWTIRLTPEDQVALQALCHFYGLNRPDAVRRAVREVLASREVQKHIPPTSPLSGVFIPLSEDNTTAFSIRLKRKVSDGS